MNDHNHGHEIILLHAKLEAQNQNLGCNCTLCFYPVRTATDRNEDWTLKE